MLEYITNLRRILLGVSLLVFLSYSYKGTAQGYFEGYSSYGGSNFSIVGGIGSTYLLGDIANEGGEGDYEPRFATPGNAFQLNLGLSYRLTNYISVRAEGTVYQLYSEPFTPVWDVPFKSLKTFGVDGYLAVVHNIVSQARIDQGQGKFNGYVLAGGGLTYFDPKDGETGDQLRDNIATRYQSQDYAKIASIIVVGGGIEYYFSSFFSLGGELLYKHTSSDLIDNISPVYIPGDPNSNPNGKSEVTDGYLTFGLKLKYSLGKKGNGNLSGFNYKSYLKKSRRRAKYK